MASKVYAPNVHLFAFHLKKRDSTDSTTPPDKQNLLWEKCKEILSSKFGVTKPLVIEEQEGYRVDLYKDKTEDDVHFHFEGKVYPPDNTPLAITGMACPVRIHDTFTLALNLRRPEEENDKKTKPVPLNFLKLLNPDGCLMPEKIGSSLGQTLLLTVWYTEDKQWLPWKSPQNRQELRKLADDCLKEFIPNKINPPQFYQEGELFGSPIFEYRNPIETENYCHILIWVYCQRETSDKFVDNYSNFINLFCYRNKAIGAYQRSQKIERLVAEQYLKIDPYINEIFNQMPVGKTLNKTELNKFKQYLKDISQKHLEYSIDIRDLDIYRLNVEDNAQNYQREIRDIKSNLPANELSFLENFLESDYRLFSEQIQADLGYFGHGSDLLEKALNAIRGRVEIEQAERDRELQNTIQAVGTGIGVGVGVAGILATSYPLIEKPWQLPSPQQPLLLPHPFFIATTLSCLLGGGLGWLAWWITRKKLKP